MRGTQHRYHIAVVIRGIIPACAGSTSLSVRVVSVRRDHPRMCGEHRVLASSSSVHQGSSPHVRGARFVTASARCATGIIPACAGSTCSRRSRFMCARDHPRMCGEHAVLDVLFDAVSGSSPHVRGAPRQYAQQSADWRDHPRMCGEHLTYEALANRLPGSSPHVRGAQVESEVFGVHLGIIPACAGSTLRK